MPDRPGQIARERPALQSLALHLHRLVDHVEHHRLVRVIEARLQPLIEGALVHLAAARPMTEGAVVPQHRLPNALAHVRVVRPIEANAEVFASHPRELGGRGNGRAVVMDGQGATTVVLTPE